MLATQIQSLLNFACGHCTDKIAQAVSPFFPSLVEYTVQGTIRGIIEYLPGEYSSSGIVTHGRLVNNKQRQHSLFPQTLNQFDIGVYRSGESLSVDGLWSSISALPQPVSPDSVEEIYVY